jgi:hypothetical protein
VDDGISGGGKLARATLGAGRRLGIDQVTSTDPEYAKAGLPGVPQALPALREGRRRQRQRLIDYLEEDRACSTTPSSSTPATRGSFLGEHDLMDKRWMYEEAFRMPFMVHWPGVKPGSVNDWLINNTDFAPTMLELAGAGNARLHAGPQLRHPALGVPNRSRTTGAGTTYYRYWMHMAHSLSAGPLRHAHERYKLIFFYGCTPDGSMSRVRRRLPGSSTISRRPRLR